MAGFPEDVMIDILLRLPPKSLGRSRCVSKHWNTLITTPSFIKAHLHRASKFCHLICQESKHTELMMSRLSKGYHSWSESDDEEELSVSKLKLRFTGSTEFSNLDPHPAITDGFNNFKLIDSFNGIVCLYAVNEKASTSRIWLWNPAINDCFVVPEPRFPILSAYMYCVGFGFNPLTSHLGDYKVVSVTVYYEGLRPYETCSSRAEIYSRRTNSWKELVGWFPKWYSREIGSQQVILEEYICWSPYYIRWSGDQYNDMNAIVSFNVVSEEFHAMALPDSIPSSVGGCITLLDSCVSLMASSFGGYEVWTMKEFGNISSWSKLYNFNFSYRFGRTMSIPLGFASTNEALFLKWHSNGFRNASNKEIHSYDTRTMTLDESKTISFDHAVTDCCLKLYVESLIPVSRYISSLDEGQSSDK